MNHAVLSPSSAHRWLACPGSIQANADKPWEQNVYALEGTTAHALLELCLRLHAEPSDFVGKVLEAGHMAIDEDMADAVGYALDYVNSYTADVKSAQVLIESPVYPGKTLGTTARNLWGTPDIQISVPGKELITIDYKHGIGIPVAVKDNPQIRLYHIGKRAEAGRYRRYRSVVIQPRVPRRRPVQEHTLTDAELMQWAEKTVMPVIPIALSGNAPRNAGDWCKYCHASGSCPAQLKQTFDKAAKEFGKVSKDPKAVPPVELARYLDMVAMVEEAIASLKEVATKAAHAGVPIPGWAPGFTRSRRVWRDEEKANALLKKLGLETKERYAVQLVSPAQAEDALKAKQLMPRAKRGQPKPTSPIKEEVAYTEPNPTILKAP